MTVGVSRRTVPRRRIECQETRGTRNQDAPRLRSVINHMRVGGPRLGRLARSFVLAAATLSVLGCEAGPVPATPLPVPGSPDAPREVNLITKDYAYLPSELDLVPGETVLLHVVNGGLVIHEAVIGDASVQEAWEVAEAATVGSPPGPTPVVSVPPDVAGLRIVVRSGERLDVLWTVPADAHEGPAWIVGCHIPGHFARGMQAPVRWVTPDAAP